MAPVKIDNIELLQFHPEIATLSPSKFTIFDIINPYETPDGYLHTDYLRITVLDSPIRHATMDVAAMIVPIRCESEWIFTSEDGFCQLHHQNPQFSRIVLVSNTPLDHQHQTSYVIHPFPVVDAYERVFLENYWVNFVKKNLCPRWLYECDVSCLNYNKNGADMICRFIEKRGGIWVDLVAFLKANNEIQFSRGLSFEETPNVIQSQLIVLPNPPIHTTLGLGTKIKQLSHTFQPNFGVLVPPHLNAMVKGIGLIGTRNLDKSIRGGYRPRALIVGVGGGALVSFLSVILNLEVVGVEVCPDVLLTARQFFGLKHGHGEFVRLILGDGVKLIPTLYATSQRTSRKKWRLPHAYKELEASGQYFTRADEFDGRFDVIMVDLVTDVVPITAPTSDFMMEEIIESAEGVLDRGHGILIINVVRLDNSTYYTLVRYLKKCFRNVYRIIVGDEQSGTFVLIASRSRNPVIQNHHANSISALVKSVISEEDLQPMVKI